MFVRALSRPVEVVASELTVPLLLRSLLILTGLRLTDDTAEEVEPDANTEDLRRR